MLNRPHGQLGHQVCSAFDRMRALLVVDPKRKELAAAEA